MEVNKATAKFVSIFHLSDIKTTVDSLLQKFQGNKVFTFNGDLGAGKTTFIEEICRQLGSEDQLSSPTYSIINEYESKVGKIYHCDLYRLKNLDEAIQIGIEDVLYSDRYCFIEWPDVILPLIPSMAVHITIETIDFETRKITAL